MQFRNTILPVVVTGASFLVASLPARAAVITYTDRNAFLAALSSSSTDNYSDLTLGSIPSPLNRTIPNFAYNAAASSGLFSNPSIGTGSLTTNFSGETLTLTFTSGAPTAVGGYFFNTNGFGVSNAVITVTANPGASTQAVLTNSGTNFFGWLDDSGTPFTSLVINPSAGRLSNVDDLILGQAAPPAPAQVPGPLPVMGAAAAFSISRRLRSRIAAARPRA